MRQPHALGGADAATDYGQRIVEGGLYSKEWSTDWITLPLDERREAKDFNYTYGSPYRPLPHGARRDLTTGDIHVVHIRNGTRSFIFTDDPLSIDAVAQYELFPFGHRAIGQFILDVAKRLGQPVELAHKEFVRVAFLFRNPRRKWQMSYFDESGPSSHDESAGDPVKLVYDAYLAGYRRLAVGMLDEMARNFDESVLRRMASGRM